MNEPCFGTCGRDEVKKGGGGKSVKKAPAKREISILKTWRGRAWDTSECSDAQHPKFGCFGLPVPATSFREQSVMSGCRYLPRVVGSNCFETGAIVRHETGTGGPKYPIAPGDSWPALVIRNNRTEFELRVLCVGILRSIPRTAPPCFQYTDFSLCRRLFPPLPSRPLCLSRP